MGEAASSKKNQQNAKTLAIIGAGAWGTALAAAASRKSGRQTQTMLWAREPEVVAAINKNKENDLFLPDQKLPENLCATNDLAQAAQADYLLLAVPAQFMRATSEALKPHLADRPRCLISCAKGLEAKTTALMSEVLQEVLPAHICCCLSGPSFAVEVAAQLPTALVLAADDPSHAKAMQSLLASDALTILASRDLVGVQIGGAVKNVLAIACGMAAGSGLGQNAHAALLTLGYGELLRFGLAAGGQAETLAGLAGLGDMLLTCNSAASRNFSLGRELAQGSDAKTILAARHSVSEGALGVAGLLARAKQLTLEMPIARAVSAVLAGKATPEASLRDLLAQASF